MGICYGIMISHLHDKDQIAPVKVEGIPHHSWGYLACWSVVAVALGQLMPWVDRLWEGDDDNEEAIQDDKFRNGNINHKRSSSSSVRQRESRGLWAPEWLDVVRCIGAFVGIAFAIVSSPIHLDMSYPADHHELTRPAQRKLPWQSTLQLSLTLALSNPAIWYLLDRTPPGFVLSTTVALSGTAMLLSVNPALIPSPGHVTPRAKMAGSAANATLFGAQLPHDGALVGGLVSQESVGVATWIASVLFVSCVCFGNVGRRL